MDEKAFISQQMLNLILIKLSWALFFILVGGSWILGSLARVSNVWALVFAGSGAILLLLNLLMIIWRINISRFTVGLGLLGLVVGLAQYYAMGNISIWAAALLIIGFFMLFEVLKK
ncbi:Uncharacterised protein [uncultured archaeon]|nr:Uncharacterised protein [uncultured archaeon]